ncbi:MAG: DUF4097 domain-containing protein [Acidobacteriales bacterium]|nr:DUF4097 domain-containing protein [Terriglobales bacterium]
MRMKQLCVASAVLLSIASTWAAEARKEFKYTATPGSTVTIVNEFGPVTLKPAPGRQVLITATTHSDKVEVDSSQNGNRIEARTHFLKKADEQEGLVSYEVSIPANVAVLVRAATGPIQAEKLQGDMTLKGDAARISVRDVNNADLHLQTVGGPIELTNVSGARVEIISSDGSVSMKSVSGPKVSVNTASGDISYDGDLGSNGEYSFTNHSGNIDLTLPANASIDLMARSITGSVQNDLPLQKKSHASLSLVDEARSSVGTSNAGSCSVQLRSFSGKIRVKKR